MLNCISYLYESEYYTMGKRKKSKIKKLFSKIGNVFKPKNIFKILGFLASCGAIATVFVLYGDFRVIQSKIDELNEVPTILTEVNTKLDDHLTYSDKIIDSFESELDSFKNSNNPQLLRKPTASMQGCLFATENKSDTNFLSALSVKDNDIIGEDPNTGKKCNAKKLKNKKILLPYMENGKEVYFYGQYNKYYHWDGHCILNIYDNNKLSVIMDGWYKDGELISYNRITYDTKTKKVNKKEKKIKIWRISKREHNGNVNTGETYTYFKDKNKKKKFTLKNVESKNILSTMDFENWLNRPLEGYYNGNTSDGKYNDETGKAYLIKYFEDGTVRTLYCGNFKGGEFNDHTGNAWYISTEEGADSYIYFKGGFTNGDPDETDNHKRENIENEKIHKLIEDMKFNSPINLRWDNNLNT